MATLSSITRNKYVWSAFPVIVLVTGIILVITNIYMSYTLYTTCPCRYGAATHQVETLQLHRASLNILLHRHLAARDLHNLTLSDLQKVLDNDLESYLKNDLHKSIDFDLKNDNDLDFHKENVLHKGAIDERSSTMESQSRSNGTKVINSNGVKKRNARGGNNTINVERRNDKQDKAQPKEKPAIKQRKDLKIVKTKPPQSATTESSVTNIINGVKDDSGSRNKTTNVRTNDEKHATKQRKAVKVAKVKPPGSITKHPEPKINECFLQKYCLQFVIKPEKICHSLRRVNLFVFVYSMAGNYERRDMIRKTWANQKVFSQERITHIFILGQNKANATIQKEAKLYNDIVMVNIEDAFHTLTLKGISGLKFAVEFCPNAKFVMKTDDDMWINMFLLQNKLNNLITQNDTKGVLMGRIWKHSPVFHKGRYAISKQQFPSSYWPPFCSGSGYIMSMDVTKTLFKLAMQDPSKYLIHLDDPYMTGVLVSRTKLKIRDIGSYYSIYRRNYRRFSDHDLYQSIFLHIHDKDMVDMSAKEHMDMWNRLVALYSGTKLL